MSRVVDFFTIIFCFLFPYSPTSFSNSLTPVKLSYSLCEPFKATNNVTYDTEKCPVIIMHGLLGSKNNWNKVSRFIRNRTNHKVIPVDARNHGNSPQTREFNYPLLAEDVRLLMSDLKIAKINAIGHSLGGRVMMYLALEYPHLINSLIIVDTSPVRIPHAINNLSSLLLDAMVPIKFDNKIPLPKARKLVDQQLKEKIPDLSMRQFVLTNMVEGEDGRYKWRANLDSLVSAFPSITNFQPPNKTFEGPVLFIGGGASTCLREEDHKDIINYFPKAEFQYIQGAGHWVHVEKLDEFLNPVCNFLNRTT